MKNVSLLLILTFMISGFSAQSQSKLEVAKNDLKQLKQSFLLIRLQTKETTSRILESKGMMKEAEEVRRKQYEENRETILSFTQTFDFCPVYFFYSDYSESVRDKKLAGKVFDANLELVDTAVLQSEVFYTAEFSQTEKLGISGLIIMDSHLIPLEPPFPYYERKYVFFSLIKLSKARMAEKMNINLHEHYTTWFGDN